MPRTIPITLAEHLKSDATTMCVLVKITPVQPGFDPFGITTLDRDIIYDDGTGPLLYSAAIGSEPSNLTASADLSISGGETKQLMPVFDTPIDEKDIAAGACDYAKFVAYQINYNDLTSGHHIVLQTGTTGRNVVTDSGLSWTTEFRGLTQPLKQSITEKWSLTCRALFGSTVGNAQSRYPCNFDISTLWQEGTVIGVGIDTTQLIFAEGLRPPYGGAPGAVEWLTGANAGRTDESESFTLTGVFEGTGTFTSTSGSYESVHAPTETITFTGTGTFDGSNGGTFTGTGTWTGQAGRGGTGTFFGTGTYLSDGSFSGTGTWKADEVTLDPNEFLGVHASWGYAHGNGTFAGTGTGDPTIANEIGLTFGTAFPIQVGDTFRFRDDCPKTPVACKARNNWQNYRGESSIPVSDNGAISIGNIGGAVTTTTGD